MESTKEKVYRGSQEVNIYSEKREIGLPLLTGAMVKSITPDIFIPATDTILSAPLFKVPSARKIQTPEISYAALSPSFSAAYACGERQQRSQNGRFKSGRKRNADESWYGNEARQLPKIEEFESIDNVFLFSYPGVNTHQDQEEELRMAVLELVRSSPEEALTTFLSCFNWGNGYNGVIGTSIRISRLRKEHYLLEVSGLKNDLRRKGSSLPGRNSFCLDDLVRKLKRTSRKKRI